MKPALLALACLTAAAGCRTPPPPSTPPAVEHDRRAAELLRQKNPSGAEEEWRTAIALDPKYARAYQSLAALYEMSGRPAVAAETLAPLRKADPKAPHVECRRAELYFQADGYEVAALLAREALRREPDCPLAHLTHGLALTGAGKRDDALAAMKEAHRLGGSAYALPLAQALGEAGKTDEALALARPLLETHPDRARVRTAVATLLARRDPTEAKRLLDEALSISPKYAPAHAERGMLLARTGGDPKEARREMESALAAGFTSPALAAALADLLERTKSPDAAAARRLARDGAALTAALQKERADFLDHPDDDVPRLRLAELEAQRGDLPDAMALTQQALKKNPNDPEALALLRKLGTPLREQGR